MKTRGLAGNQNQKGMVSLIVVSVITILLALITIGFSQVMDRELRQALDQDLSTQAYYAAESGLNDARAFLDYLKTKAGQAEASTIDPTKCLGSQGLSNYNQYFASNGDISGNGVVRYPCILLNPFPPELNYDVPGGNSVIFQVVNKNKNAPLGHLYISWENSYYTDPSQKQPLGTCSGKYGPCQLPQENNISANATGMLRVTVYPVYASAQYAKNGTDTQLANDSKTYFLYPNLSGNPNNVTLADLSNDAAILDGGGATPRGDFVQGNCSTKSYPPLPLNGATKRYCNAEIISNTGLLTSAQIIYVQITAIYRNVSVSVEGTNKGDQKQVPFGGAEASVDVTGEGNDVLQRVRAYVPYNSNYSIPITSLTSMQTVCKRFRVPKIGPNSWGDAFTDPYDPSNDPNCQI